MCLTRPLLGAVTFSSFLRRVWVCSVVSFCRQCIILVVVMAAVARARGRDAISVINTRMAAGAQPRLKSWGGKVCAPCPVKGRAGCWVRKGVAPSRCELGSGGITTGKFWKTHMLNPAFLWLLAVKFLFLTIAKSCGGGGNTVLVPQPKRWGDQSSTVLRLLRL